MTRIHTAYSNLIVEMDEYFYEDYIPSYYEKRKYDVKCALAYSCMGFVDNDYSVLLIDKWADTNRTRIPNELFVHYCFAHDVVPFEKDMERSNNIISEYSQLYLFDMMSEKHIENVVSHNQETTEIFNKEKCTSLDITTIVNVPEIYYIQHKEKWT